MHAITDSDEESLSKLFLLRCFMPVYAFGVGQYVNLIEFVFLHP